MADARTTSATRLPPHHQAVVTEETRALKLAAGLKFGDCTALTLSVSAEAMLKAFAPPDLSSLDKIFRQGPHDVERHLFDAELRGRLERLTKLSGGSPDTAGEESLPGMLIKVPVSENVSVLVNTGFAGAEPSYTILSGTSIYRVGLHKESSLVEMAPLGHQVTLKFEEHVNAGYLEHIPPLSKLMELQGKSGEELRNALPELSAHMQGHLHEFAANLAKIAGSPPKFSFIEVDIPSDLKEHPLNAEAESGPRSVTVRLYKDEECKLDRFEIVGYQDPL